MGSQVSTRPQREKLAALQQEKFELEERINATDRKFAELQDAVARAKREAKKMGEMHDARVAELREVSRLKQQRSMAMTTLLQVYRLPLPH